MKVEHPVEIVRFSALPWLVKFGVGVSLFHVWNLFEFEVIDKWLWPYLPFYKKEGACLWDFAAIVVIIGALVFYSRCERRMLASKPPSPDRNAN